MGSTSRWTVGGERMDYLSEVRSETLSGCSTGHGALGKIVEENQLLREHVAERNAIIEKQGIENAKLKSDIDYLNVVLQGSRAKQDEFQAENERIRAEHAAILPLANAAMKDQMREMEWAHDYGYTKPPRVEINGENKTPPITGSIEELEARGFVKRIASGEATLGNTEGVVRLVVDFGPAATKLSGILENIPALLRAFGAALDESKSDPPPTKD